jgi:hypothetical protein
LNIITFLSAAALAVGPVAASAATFVSFDGSTGVFGNDRVDAPTFADTIDLGALAAGAYRISGTISSTYQAGAEAVQDIDFASVSLNGAQFAIGNTGQFEFRYINDILSQGSNLFRISGTAGSDASYAGTVNVAAVPEPATWALMLIGFGTVGYVMRGRKQRRRSWPKGVWAQV